MSNNVNSPAEMVSERQIAEALHGSTGNFSLVIKELSTVAGRAVSRRYLQDRIDRSPWLQEVLEDILQGVIDDAESNIFRAVRNGRLEESKFVLTTIGKDRGYTKTVQVDVVDADQLAMKIVEGRKARRGPNDQPAATAA